MSTKARIFRIPCLLTLAAAAALAVAPEPASAKKKKVIVEEYRARATSMNRGTAVNFVITIHEWTTAEERQALLQTLVEGGSDALYDALQDQSEKGYVREPNTLGYKMRYAFSFEDEDKRRVVLATDRPLGFLELGRGSRSLDYNVSMVVLEINRKTGSGAGLAMGGAEFSVDEETGRITIEHTGTQPTKLTRVKRVKMKKKKE